MHLFPHFSAVLIVVACSISRSASIFPGEHTNERRRTALAVSVIMLFILP